MQVTTTNFADILAQYGISAYAAGTQTAMQAWMVGKYLVRANTNATDIAFMLYSENTASSDYWDIEIIKVVDSTNAVTLEYGYTIKKSSYIGGTKEALIDLMGTIA